MLRHSHEKTTFLASNRSWSYVSEIWYWPPSSLPFKVVPVSCEYGLVLLATLISLRLRLITLTEVTLYLFIVITLLLYIERILSFSLRHKKFSKFVPNLSFPQVLSVFSLSRNQQTAPLPPSSTFLCLWVLVFNYFFDALLGQRSKPGSHVFASSLTASNTKRANLTLLPSEIMHRGHTWPLWLLTWHGYPWPWVSLTWLLSRENELLYNLQLDDVPGADFENSLCAFGQSEKR